MCVLEALVHSLARARKTFQVEWFWGFSLSRVNRSKAGLSKCATAVHAQGMGFNTASSRCYIAEAHFIPPSFACVCVCVFAFGTVKRAVGSGKDGCIIGLHAASGEANHVSFLVAD